MKAALFVNSFAMGGAERYSHLVLEGLAQYGIELVVVCPRESPFAARLAPQSNVTYLDLGAKIGRQNWLSQFLRAPLHGWRLWRTLRELKGAGVLLVLFQFKKEQILGSPLARLTGQRVVWVEHGPPHNALRWAPAAFIYRLASSLAHAVIVPSNVTSAALEEMGVNRVLVIHHGLDVSSMAREVRALRATTSRNSDRMVITNLCALSKDRGHEVFLRASLKVHASHPHAEFWIVGEGPERPAIESAINSLGATWVRMCGEVTDVRPILAATDVFVSSSHAEGEGLPLRILEAMSAGLAIVATDIGGTREALTPGHGLLVPPRDSDALAAAIDELVRVPELREQLGQAALQRVSSVFDLEQMLLATSELIRKVE